MTNPDHLFDYAKQIDIQVSAAVASAVARLPISERERACVSIMAAGMISGRVHYATAIGSQASKSAQDLLEVAHHIGMTEARMTDLDQQAKG